MQLGEQKRQVWDGSYTFRKRRSGLGGWFLVVGNLKLRTEKCRDCGCPYIAPPFTHYTAGKIPEALALRSWLDENDVETRQFFHCTKCWSDVIYESGGSGPGATVW